MKITLEGEIEDLLDDLIRTKITEVDIFDKNYDVIGDKVYQILKEAIEEKNINVNDWFKQIVTTGFFKFADRAKEEIWEELNPEFDEMKEKIKELEETIKRLEEKKN